MSEVRPIPAMMAIPEIAHRIQRGQQFNSYELSAGEYAVCLGPVTDALSIADCTSAQVAKMVEDALRTAAGQHLFDQEQFQ